MAQICFEVADIHKVGDEMYAKFLSVVNTQDKWISGEEAMRMLRITSKATLQKYRDEDRITFSHPDKKIILYDRESILKFLDDHSNKSE